MTSKLGLQYDHDYVGVMDNGLMIKWLVMSTLTDKYTFESNKSID